MKPTEYASVPRSDQAASRMTEGTNSRGRLCFYLPHVYPITVGGDFEFAGGIEVQHWAVVRALAKRGFDVTVATADYGQAPIVRRQDVTLFRVFREDAGVPGVRFFYPRLWKTMSTLRDVAADVYLASGASLLAGWAYDAARLRRSRFVFFAASDKDALRSLPALNRRRERWWYIRALRGADARIAQTEVQRRLFRENFAVDAQVIPNPVEIPPTRVDAGANNVVLWLSTYKQSKRPEWFLELPRRLPQLRFVMVGFPPSAETNESWQAAKHAAETLPNLEVHGFVAHSGIGEFLREAALFAHTSPLEGFPNTLLEAWSHGIPSVSAVDPGGVVEEHRIGEVVGNFEELVDAVADAMAAPDRRRALGARARDYVERHHGSDQTFEPLAALLDRVVEDGRSSKGR
jgi:glycosyltransferase involved in cell wall biosynthesis